MRLADLFSGDNRFKTAMAMNGIGSAMRGQDVGPMLQNIMMMDMMQKDKAAEAEQRKQADALLSNIFGGGSQTIPQTRAQVGPPSMSGGNKPKGIATDAMVALNKSTSQNPYRDAIASIESAGSGDYAAVGPNHPKLGRALGRYQIMEANIPIWSKEILGQEVTPEQFLSTPQIQDAIFDGKFGQYVQKFGPEGAAQAWFAGPGGVGKVNRKDSLGTSVGDYTQKFSAAIGGQPVRTAHNGGITREQALAVARHPGIDADTKQFVLAEYRAQQKQGGLEGKQRYMNVDGVLYDVSGASPVPVTQAQPDDNRTTLQKNVEWLMSPEGGGYNREDALQKARSGQNIYTGDIMQSAADSVVDPSNLAASDKFTGANAKGAVGTTGAITSGINALGEALLMGQAAPNIDKAQKELTSLSTRTMLGLAAEFPGRPSNLTRERIEELTVRPGDLFTGPEGALNKTTSMLSTIRESIMAANAILEDPIYSQTDKAQAKTALRQLGSLYSDYKGLEQALMGGGTGQNTTSSGVKWRVKD